MKKEVENFKKEFVNKTTPADDRPFNNIRATKQKTQMKLNSFGFSKDAKKESRTVEEIKINLFKVEEGTFEKMDSGEAEDIVRNQILSRISTHKYKKMVFQCKVVQ